MCLRFCFLAQNLTFSSLARNAWNLVSPSLPTVHPARKDSPHLCFPHKTLASLFSIYKCLQSSSTSLKNAKMSIKGRMVKWNALCTHNRMGLSLKKLKFCHVLHSIDEPGQHYTKNIPDTKDKVHLHSIYVRKKQKVAWYFLGPNVSWGWWKISRDRC